MKTLNEAEIQKWFEQPSVSVRMNQYGLLSFRDTKRHSAVIETPEGSAERIALSHALLSFREFFGGMLWIKEWRVGDLEGMTTGWRVMEDMRKAMGQAGPLEAAPGQLFRLDEVQDARAFLTVVLLWDWQAFWVPSTSEYFYYLHHNDKIEINASSEETFSGLTSHLSGWRPVRGSVLGLQES
jgi:hypothetical protein